MIKKGDISINVIIIAALALIVLVIVGAILTGNLGRFSAKVEKGCYRGKCVPNNENCEAGFTLSSEYSCSDEAKICCVPEAIENQI